MLLPSRPYFIATHHVTARCRLHHYIQCYLFASFSILHHRYVISSPPIPEAYPVGNAGTSVLTNKDACYVFQRCRFGLFLSERGLKERVGPRYHDVERCQRGRNRLYGSLGNCQLRTCRNRRWEIVRVNLSPNEKVAIRQYNRIPLDGHNCQAVVQQWVFERGFRPDALPDANQLWITPSPCHKVSHLVDPRERYVIVERRYRKDGHVVPERYWLWNEEYVTGRKINVRTVNHL